MGNGIKDSLVYFRENYPELKIEKKDKNYVISGRFIISAKFKDELINIAPRVIMILPNNYPNLLPQVFETEGKYNNEHQLDNGELCVATPFDLLLELNDSKNISNYIQKFLIPYFISIVIYKRKGIYIYGDREHGVEGFNKSIADYFKIRDYNSVFILQILQWCSKRKKFKRISFDNHYLVEKKYNLKISKLRCVGIPNLRRICKLLENSKEFEKKYYIYKSLEYIYKNLKS